MSDMPSDFTDFRAPWEVYPDIPCGSIHWRMGAGESAMGEWGAKFQTLTQEQRFAYRGMHLAPPEWGKWLDRIIESIPKQKDETEIGRIIRREVDEIFVSFTFDSPDSAEVKTAKIDGGQTESGHVFKLKRSTDGWEILKHLTQRWTV